jgi:hypothetical protein
MERERYKDIGREKKRGVGGRDIDREGGIHK